VGYLRTPPWFSRALDIINYDAATAEHGSAGRRPALI
jgi:hypothetical protein